MLEVRMASGGTGAGTKKAWVGGHGPKCICSKCSKGGSLAEMKAAAAAQVLR